MFTDKRSGDKNELIFGKLFFSGNDGPKDHLAKLSDPSWKKFRFLHDRSPGSSAVPENHFDRHLPDNFSRFCANLPKLCQAVGRAPYYVDTSNALAVSIS